ncbi:hypothetical protein UFOVP1518_57 [uncultured Caudovirales phage]|uniref:Uncharacterized protein n=1 Tax=uncultured Caudovirales phage TaxID=2100421 RepID=A0A6J5QBQ4_9CAUD|nr:hypothetical protein UFOVP475_2 [uncultured Caudovirales phage]CAB4169458.1 hypothetical protein UFOVP897_32 [uncultured Caudovirales phage]CAB4175763.1 hypothetical protein UFOVP984_2 [uncultured Caudovirales phage]CAB4180932.1 hypothetical protein UFOVP1072_3 [uncultured Caudovirales phage]CAB4190992.1 hypothetical protein UFOVP1211_1 [uncultured Caudovirales phage]
MANPTPGEAMTKNWWPNWGSERALIASGLPAPVQRRLKPATIQPKEMP